MAMTPEAKVKAEVRKILDSYKPDLYYFSPAANGYGRVGIPDIICCVGGRFLAIECKAGKNTLTERQKRELDDIYLAKGTTRVVYEGDVASVRVIVRTFLGERSNDPG